MRRGPYWPHLYLVKEDGEPALRQWALSMLIQDRSDQAPSYQQYLALLRDKVRLCSVFWLVILTNDRLASGERIGILNDYKTSHDDGFL